ncbi:hypothetical protein [Paraburkholderia xenovorans]|uniref:hypothetical protein n=1 Tax=Paraburkholderia xenovorans TaxID=36873 RepID=UPI0038B826B5
MKVPSVVADFYQSYSRPALDASGKYLYDLMMPDGGQPRIYTLASALQLNDDLDVGERLPEFFAVGDDAGEEIVCVEVQTVASSPCPSGQ